MKIDDRTEQLVRDTLHWVVKRDLDKLDAALKAFPDETARKAALALVVAISGFVLIDLHNARPTPDQVAVLAAEIGRMEAWASVSADEAASFMNAVVAGRSLTERLAPDDIVVLAFVVAGSLLSARPLPEGQWWFNYLDKVEAAIEAAG
ncbi:hypothetical protein M8C17_21905 [Micromonospora sp. RHAY321]|uniref:hypothetical protein n=1 Tax=Micromonospora sp. RHAY321 TaxID=2944807 RepID=UPI00207C786B|nr:hypothetical protein [Micromonospora sp. RHAY321]MCO1597809.1 hypothetical protein [Micromonospora sp. RHAY321]